MTSRATLPSANQPAGRISLGEWLLYFIFVNALSLDFKPKESGGNALQLVFVFIAFLSFVLLTLQRGRRESSKAILWLFGFYGLCFVTNLSSVFVSSFDPPDDFDIQQCFRNAVTFTLAPMAIMVVNTAYRRGYTPKLLMGPIVVAAFISSISRVIFGRSEFSRDISEVRYEVLGPLSWVLVGLVFVGFFFSQKFDWLGLIAGGLFGFMVLMSGTRSLLLGAFACLAFTPVVIIVSNRLKDIRYLGRLALASIGAMIAATIALGLISLIRPTAVEDMLNRAERQELVDPAGNPRDLTFMMREAQVNGLLERVNKGPYQFLFGNGSGTPFLLDRRYEGAVPPRMFFSRPANFSDLSLLYAVYSMGWLVGGLFVLMMAALPVASIVVAKKLESVKLMEDAKIVMFAGYSILAFLALNVTWGGTHERLAMLIFGVLVGLIGFGYTRYRDAADLILANRKERRNLSPIGQPQWQ